MAVKIPDPLKRRHVLESPPEGAKALAVAEAYLEQGRRLEALLFLKYADAQDRLDAIYEEGIAEGDAFLVRECAAVMEREIDGREWRRVAEAAASLGKEFYAADAARQADRLGA